MVDNLYVSNEEENEDNADVELEELGGLDDFQCHCSRNYLNQFSAVYIATHIKKITEMTKDEQEMYIKGVYNISLWITSKRGEEKEKENT